MPVVGTPRTYQKKFAFLVEIEDITSAKFTKCSEISAEVAEVQQWEGGSNTAEKDPGRVTTSDATLERGVATGDSDLYAWWLDVIRMSAGPGIGLPTAFIKKEVSVIQLERDRSVLRQWILNKAWPKKFVAGEWDNEADENVVEMVVLAYKSFDLIEGDG